MAATATSVEQIIEKVNANEQAGVQRLLDWLRMPSISTDPAYKGDVRTAALWCADRLKEAGIAAELRETGTTDKPGHPIVWAQHPGPKGYTGPHVLFYGHYDVQPPDPLDLWKSPPFEPVILPADGPGDVPQERIVARGSCDDKGQVATFLEAVRAWHEVGGEIPCKLTIMIEGEEESGSVNLERFAEQNKAALAQCDICVISDTGMLGRGKPAITSGVRGLAYTEVKLHGSDQDLHSGMWGGRCPNPINELSKVLAQLWDNDRRVTMPGFYDDVQGLPQADRDAWAPIARDYPKMLEKIGFGPEANIGETGFNALEREWARPTCDINGIFGGYMGEGAKTVIPSWAAAKVSFRLVANQDPAKITKMFEQWLNQRTPPGCRWAFHDHGGGFPGNVASESPYMQAAIRALRTAGGGADPAIIRTGGSIPVVGMLKGELGLDTLLVGFGLDDDRVHSPNEKFELECYRLGCRTHVALLDELAKMKK